MVYKDSYYRPARAECKDFPTNSVEPLNEAAATMGHQFAHVPHMTGFQLFKLTPRRCPG